MIYLSGYLGGHESRVQNQDKISLTEVDHNKASLNKVESEMSDFGGKDTDDRDGEDLVVSAHWNIMSIYDDVCLTRTH